MSTIIRGKNNTTSIPKLKAYMFFEKSNQVKFDQNLRTLSTIIIFVDTIGKHSSLSI
jgi:hypothetical protein